jgi:hypothetical protein
MSIPVPLLSDTRPNALKMGCMYQIIELYRRDTLVDTRDDLLGNSRGVNMIGVEAVTQPRNTGCDLVELNAFLAPI